ncbi:MAG: hypothetical protein ACM3ZF_01990 [Mycobacterium leprae]
MAEIESIRVVRKANNEAFVADFARRYGYVPESFLTMLNRQTDNEIDLMMAQFGRLLDEALQELEQAEKKS